MDVGFLDSLTNLLRGGGPFAAFVLMIWLLEPRFRAQMAQPHRAAVFIPVYVLNLLIAVLMLFAAIYFWFIKEGVLGGEGIHAKGNVANVPVNHVLFARNEELFLRRNQREGSGYLYDWIILTEDSDFDEDLFLLLSPQGDRPGNTERYILAWSDVDRSRAVELQLNDDRSMCVRVRTEEGDECKAVLRETLPSAGRAVDSPSRTLADGTGSPFWRELLVGRAHAQEPLTDTQFLGDLLRYADVFERREARAALIDAGPDALPMLDELVALDPQSYRINLAVLSALNAWEISNADALPALLMAQAPRWLAWPDAALRREAVAMLGRTLNLAQIAPLVSQARTEAKAAPAGIAVAIASSDLYRALGRRMLDAAIVKARSGEAGAMAELPALVRQLNALYALAFDALDPSSASDEATATLAVQIRLDALGFQVDGIDGRAGPATRAAIEQFAAGIGVKPPESMTVLEPALVAAQRTAVLDDWRRALAMLDETGTLSDELLDFMNAYWSAYGKRLIEESPPDFRDHFTARVAESGAGGFVDDASALYADALRAVLAKDWSRALDSLQLVQRFGDDFSDAAAIELLIQRNRDALEKDDSAVAFAVGQILWCYDAGMADAVKQEFKAWADNAGIGEASCFY